MLADPPQLVGKRVRFVAVVKDQYGETERARVRVWTDGNIEMFRNLSREDSRAISVGLMAKLVSAVATGDIGAIPKMVKSEGH